MSEDFFEMNWDDQVYYLIENLKKLKDDLVLPGIDILLKAGETEYAVVLARDHGMIDRAIEIAVSADDYLWAALIAKQSGRREESERLYQEGLEFYEAMEMYGRAVSAARALKLPEEKIDELFRKGVAVERRKMDITRTRDALENIKSMLEVELLGREDTLSKEILDSIKKDRLTKERPPEDEESEENHGT